MRNPPEPLVRRRSARVLIVDESDRVLLLHSSGFVTPESQYFVTVGGAVDEGESLAEAAAREVFEETGLRVAPSDLEPTVARTAGELWFGQEEASYFFLRTPRFDLDFDGLEGTEVQEITGYAWLGPDQLREVDDSVFPVPIAALVERCVSGDIPAVPVELDWPGWRGDLKRCPIPGGATP
ncbi:NUDIX hydrolase [Glycomyces xiaoerkulensis]|uniref:NUDIX hydrolase n=1 Tax=Glycomyces xiaoerkulensis TaxID=2038139 RepID=UPI000C25738D|nr:NUDIX domain-containing protein [Glycomyces xiaoerkulensis]